MGSRISAPSPAQLEKKIYCDSFAELGAKKTKLGQVITSRGHTSHAIGAGDFVVLSGSVVNDGGFKTNTGVAGQYAKKINFNFLTPYDFGCVGDGVTDDTINFNKFLAAAAGRMVSVSAGVYLISATLAVLANTVLVGEGMGSAIFKQSPSFPVASPVMSLADGSQISDVCFDGQGAVNTEHVAPALIVNATVKSFVSRCAFLNNNYHGLDAGVTNARCRIDDCVFIGLSTSTTGSVYGIWFDGAGCVFHIRDSYFEGYRLNGIFVGGWSSISGCEFFGNHKQTSPVGGGQIASGISVVYCMVDNCKMDGDFLPAASGIELDHQNMHIRNCEIENMGFFGIVIQTGTGHTAIGNVCKNNGLAGIQAGSTAGPSVSDFTIANNKCFDDQGVKTQDWGVVIDITATDNWCVTGNTCTGNINSGGIDFRVPTYPNIVVNSNIPTAANPGGKIIESVVTSAAPVALTNNIFSNVTSITLTPGEWDISGMVLVAAGGTTVTTQLTSSISDTSSPSVTHIAGLPAIWRGNNTGNTMPTVAIPMRRVIVTAPTKTFYLVCGAAFTTSTLSAFGHISAERVR